MRFWTPLFTLWFLAILGIVFTTPNCLSQETQETDSPKKSRTPAADKAKTDKTSKPPAGPKAVVRPYLWKVYGAKGQTKPSFLFGTIHVSDPRVLKMHPVARKKFENADTLFVELVTEAAFCQMKAMVYDKKKLEDLIDAKTLKRIDKQLADINPFYAEHRPNFKIWAWPLILPNLETQLKNPNKEILDMNLVTQARKSQKFVGSLEQAQNQLEGLEKLSLKEQIMFLKDSLSSMEEEDKEKRDYEKELTSLYLNGDVDALEKYFEEELESDEMDEELTEKVMAAMLYDRNKRMAATIKKTLSENPEKSHFFAAGTAHFIGKKTVQDFLIADGIKIERYKVDVKNSKDENSKVDEKANN